MRDRRPTKRQAEVLALLRSGHETGHPLSIREMCHLLGVRSTNAVNDHLVALERKGLVVRRRGMGARLVWEPAPPEVTPAWLLEQARALRGKIEGVRGCLWFHEAPDGSWWRLVVLTSGARIHEAAIRAIDPHFHDATRQALATGGLHVWAWGPVPEQIGGPLGPVRIDWSAIRGGAREVDRRTWGTGSPLGPGSAAST